MNWYLLQCKPNQQARAEEHLANQAFLTFSPRLRAERLLRRQRVVRDEPVFPGYVFIQLDDNSNWRAVQCTRGVSRLVSFNGSPHVVPAELVQALRSQYEASLEPVPLFKAGDSVQVVDGCFKDVQAIVKAVTADQRIVVLMTILQSTQQLEFGMHQLVASV